MKYIEENVATIPLKDGIMGEKFRLYAYAGVERWSMWSRKKD